jgi:hypothetical protein
VSILGALIVGSLLGLLAGFLVGLVRRRRSGREHGDDQLG